MRVMMLVGTLILLAGCAQEQSNATSQSLLTSNDIYQEVQDIADQFLMRN